MMEMPSPNRHSNRNVASLSQWRSAIPQLPPSTPIVAIRWVIGSPIRLNDRQALRQADSARLNHLPLGLSGLERPITWEPATPPASRALGRNVPIIFRPAKAKP